MLKRIVGLVVVLGIVGASWAHFPALRTSATALWKSQTGWSEADRLANPRGFINHVGVELRENLSLMQKSRRNLGAELGDLSNATREQSAMGARARSLAEEFRAEYQEALANDGFPIEIRGEAYTESQVKAQVSLLLAQADGYSQSLADIEKVQAEAEQKIEELGVRIGQTESQLSALAAKRELLGVRQLTTEGETFLAQVDELMAGNTQAIAGNPVRTDRELANAEWSKPKGRAVDQRVEEFLAQVSADMPKATEPTDNDTVTVTPSSYRTRPPVQTDNQGKQRPRSKQNTKRQKPIFQQS